MKGMIYNNVTALPAIKGYVPRLHVNQMLEEGIRRSTIILEAGAGYGKTQAVSNFLKTTDAHVVWLQICELDNLTARFWEGLIYAVNARSEDLANELREIGFPDSLAKLDRCLHALANTSTGKRPCVLVLDDYHLIHDRQIHWFVENMVMAQIENFCTILIARERIPSDFSSLVDRHLLMHLTTEDLRFSRDETAEYLQLLGLELPWEKMDELYRVTEGWPFSIYLVGISLRKGDSVGENPLEATIPIIYRLMENEVFLPYPPEIRTLLVKLSLLDNFGQELVHEIAGDQIPELVELAERNMFISFNPYIGTYHIHNLFVDFLRQYQEILSEAEVNEIYNVMAEWYLTNDQPIDALIHFQKARNYSRSWKVIKSIGVEQCNKGVAELLLSIVESFPAEFEKKHPMLPLVKVNLLINNNCLEEAGEILDQLQKELCAVPEPVQQQTELLGEVYILKGLLSLYMKESEFADYFKMANRYLPNGTVYFDYSRKQADSNYAVLMRTIGKGELEKMSKALFEGMPYASRMMNGFGYGLEYVAAAEGAYFTGDFRGAAEYALQGIYRGLDKDKKGIVCLGYFVMIKLSIANGHYSDLETYVNKLEEYTKDKANTNPYPLIADIAKGWFYSMMGVHSKVECWILDDTLNGTVLPPVSSGRDRIVRAQRLLRENKFYELLAFLENSEALFRKRRVWVALLSGQIMQAIAFYYTGRHDKALRYLQMAYETASGNDLYMAFVEYGNYMRTLADGIRNMENHHLPEQWLDMIYTKSSTYAKRQSYMISAFRQQEKIDSPDSFGLTIRERGILQDLCQGLTREEIAVGHNISVNTVKSMLQSIYAKLGALNLADAVRIAVSSKIIDFQ